MATTKTIQINGIEYEEHRVELKGRFMRDYSQEAWEQRYEQLVQQGN